LDVFIRKAFAVISLKIVDSSLRHATEPIPHQISPVRRPTIARELDRQQLERLRSKKKARSGFAANVTVKIREITELLTDNRNLLTVKEKLSTIGQRLRMEALSQNVVTTG